MSESKKRIAVTGIGIVSPVGNNETDFWNSMLAGKSAAKRIQAFDPTDYRSQNGAEVDTDFLAAAMAAKRWRPVDRTVDMALVAASQALDSAGLDSSVPPRMATVIGCGGGPSLSIEDGYDRFAKKGLRGLRPTTIVRGMANVVSSQISIKFRLTGTNYVVVSACTSSTNAIGLAVRMIRHGYADHVLCGGADSFFAPVVYGAWDRLGVMTRNPDADSSYRPFDSDRDGFVLGEGAGMLVLESYDSAESRGARIRCEIAGYGESSDAEHLTHPSQEGQSAAMLAAISDANITPADIGFVSAHGTATKLNDECECASIRLALGDATDNVKVASTKPYFGHLLGSSGVVEAISVILGLEAGQVPPSLNLDNPDPACNVPFVGPEPTPIASPYAMKNSFGFGGGNAVLVLRKHDS